MLNSESESRLSTLNYNMPIRGKTDQKEDMVVTILKTLLESQTLQEAIKSDVDDAIKASVDRISINMDILEGRIHDVECKLEKARLSCFTFGKKTMTSNQNSSSASLKIKSWNGIPGQIVFGCRGYLNSKMKTPMC